MTKFREAAMAQRVCAVTGRGGSAFHAHHAIRLQDVRRHGGDPNDPRNALRLEWRVHMSHHLGVDRIPLKCLLDANLEYASELLGPAAADYLRRHYAGEDPRVDALEAA